MLKRIFSLAIAFAMILSLGSFLVVKADVVVTPTENISDNALKDKPFDFEKMTKFTSNTNENDAFAQYCGNGENITMRVAHEDGSAICADPAACDSGEGAQKKNHVLEIPSDRNSSVGDKISMRYLSMYEFGKASVDFKLPRVDVGSLELFAWSTGYSFNKNGRGIVIKEGKVLAYNLNSGGEAPTDGFNGMTEFNTTKPIAADTWYTLERYFDFRLANEDYSRFILKNKSTGEELVDSDWIKMGKNSTRIFYFSTFHTLGYTQANDTVTLDNILYWQYNNLPTMSYKSAGNNPSANNYLVVDRTHSSYPSVNAIGVSYANLLDSGSVKTAIEDKKAHRWSQKMLFTKVDASLQAEIFSYATGIAFDSSSRNIPIKIANDKVLYFSFQNNAWSTVGTEMPNFTIQKDKWYTFVFEYIATAPIKEAASSAEVTATANIIIKDETGAILSQATNVSVKPMAYDDTSKKAVLNFIKGTLTSNPVYIDDINIKSWKATIDTEESYEYLDISFEEYDVNKTFLEVLEAESTRHLGNSNKIYTPSALTGHMNAFPLVSEKTILDGELSPLTSIPPINFIFTQPMAQDTFTVNNVTISALDENLSAEQYTVTAVSNTEFKIEFVGRLSPNTVYKITLSNKILDYNSKSVMANSAKPQEFFFTTRKAMTISNVVLKNDSEAEYELPGTTLAAQEKIKAVAQVTVTDAPVDIALILGIYHGDMLRQVAIKSDTLNTNGEHTIETDQLTNDTEGATAKALVWDSPINMLPLTAPINLGCESTTPYDLDY